MWYSSVILSLCFLPDYGGSSTMKYQTYTPGYSSKSSYMYSGSRTMVSTSYSIISLFQRVFTHIMEIFSWPCNVSFKHRHWPSAGATAGQPGHSMCGISQYAVMRSAWGFQVHPLDSSIFVIQQALCHRCLSSGLKRDMKLHLNCFSVCLHFESIISPSSSVFLWGIEIDMKKNSTT